MAQNFKVTKLDSPLRGLREPADDRDRNAVEQNVAESARKPRNSQPRATPALEEAAPRDSVVEMPSDTDPDSAPAPSPKSPAAAAPVMSAPAGYELWAPPPLEEHAELLSTRVPESLSRALELHTRALRDRHALSSQKALPMKEVLAAVLWSLGDPADPAATERLDVIYRSFRARRMAAAAEALSLE